MRQGNTSMAIIKCRECGKEISDKALACPNCGCPIEGESATAEPMEAKQAAVPGEAEPECPGKKKISKAKIGLIIAVVIIVAAGVTVFFIKGQILLPESTEFLCSRRLCESSSIF